MHARMMNLIMKAAPPGPRYQQHSTTPLNHHITIAAKDFAQYCMHSPLSKVLVMLHWYLGLPLLS